MQRGKGLQYAVAGIQATPDTPIGVRSNVFVPDSEAGRDTETDRQPFYAGQVQEQRKITWDVPRNASLIFLCALFLIFGVLILNKSARRAELSKNITETENSIAALERNTARLTDEVMEARARRRIGDLACQVYSMISPENVVPTMVIAPDTRPFEEKTTLQAENSPYFPLEGNVSGSR